MIDLARYGFCFSVAFLGVLGSQFNSHHRAMFGLVMNCLMAYGSLDDSMVVI